MNWPPSDWMSSLYAGAEMAVSRSATAVEPELAGPVEVGKRELRNRGALDRAVLDETADGSG